MTTRFAQPDADTRRSRLTEKKNGDIFQLHDEESERSTDRTPRSIGALLGLLVSFAFASASFFFFFFFFFSFYLILLLFWFAALLIIP
jgi:hypothetical protein